MHITSIVFCSALVLVAIAGCGSTPAPGCGNDTGCIGGGGGHASTSSGTSTTGTATTTATTGSATTGGTGGASSTSTGSSSASSTSASTGTGSGTVCGGKQGKACLPNEYCDFPADACSFADETGACTLRPVTCPDLYAPTCACDGMVYSSPCDAAGKGVDINLNGTCTPPDGKFACGAGFCDIGIAYCEHDISDVGGVPSTWGCKTLPPTCGLPATCGCLANVPCGSMCAPSKDGAGLVVTCPGG